MNKPYSTGNQRVTIKTFGLAGTDRGIEVTGLPGKPRTWSINFFTKLPDGHQRPSIKPGLEIENAVAKGEMLGIALSRLIDEACLFIQEAAQADEDNYIERKQQRELRGDFKEKPLQGLSKFTTTTASPDEIAAAKRKREQNLQARRAADQERGRKMKGKS